VTRWVRANGSSVVALAGEAHNTAVSKAQSERTRVSDDRTPLRHRQDRAPGEQKRENSVHQIIGEKNACPPTKYPVHAPLFGVGVSPHYVFSFLVPQRESPPPPRRTSAIPIAARFYTHVHKRVR
jgi:hypothetical protein